VGASQEKRKTTQLELLLISPWLYHSAGHLWKPPEGNSVTYSGTGSWKSDSGPIFLKLHKSYGQLELAKKRK
jgi:hypothetical protein